MANKNGPEKPEGPTTGGAMLALAWNIIGIMLATSGLGYFIGWKFQDPASGAFVGGFIGLFLCGYEIWRVARKNGG